MSYIIYISLKTIWMFYSLKSKTSKAFLLGNIFWYFGLIKINETYVNADIKIININGNKMGYKKITKNAAIVKIRINNEENKYPIAIKKANLMVLNVLYSGKYKKI